MSNRFQVRRRVEFCETDAAGIAHFSAFFAYMEQAEHALLRELGTSVMVREGDVAVSWPRVQASCEFQGPVRFEDVLDVAVGVERLGTSSVAYRFDFTLDGRPVACGRMTSVCCRIEPGSSPRGIPIPVELADKLRRHLIVPDAGETPSSQSSPQ